MHSLTRIRAAVTSIMSGPPRRCHVAHGLCAGDAASAKDRGPLPALPSDHPPRIPSIAVFLCSTLSSWICGPATAVSQ